ncbi:hypothetical protein [Azorhizobium doebereinerae]|uniref:hypothetical protein n=1 Tax=Azorhizobium doebereinerae TaxID=281091 RepID=UPI00048E87DC|nr:hypothetical protein [Azorhizobium doebereinerae]
MKIATNRVSFGIDIEERLIDLADDIDIATFRIERTEVTDRLGKVVLTGAQKSWPPPPPQVDRSIYYCGFPGIATEYNPAAGIIFRSCTGGGLSTSISELDICNQLERECMFPTGGKGIPAENFDFGGISGGGMVAMVKGPIRSWMLAGVIYQGPNPSGDPDTAILGLEVIRARRAHFIRPDGTLDRDQWLYAGGPRKLIV